MVTQPQTRITASAYYDLPDYAQHDFIQLIHGEVVIGMPPIPKHQRIVREILFLFMTLSRQKGGEAFDSPIEVYLDEQFVVQPDVLYLAPESQCHVGEKRLTGAPELVVEVLSPATAKYDRHEKYMAYERHGVREYWIVDPVHEVVEVYTQPANAQQFQRLGAFGQGDTFQSTVFNQAVSVTTFFAA